MLNISEIGWIFFSSEYPEYRVQQIADVTGLDVRHLMHAASGVTSSTAPM